MPKGVYKRKKHRRQKRAGSELIVQVARRKSAREPIQFFIRNRMGRPTTDSRHDDLRLAAETLRAAVALAQKMGKRVL
jgi:hypothetical protein